MTNAAIPPGVVAEAAAAAKAWLRAADGNDDGVIAGLCMTAILLAEAFCGRVLVARGFRETVTGGGWQALTAGPVSGITAVTDAQGVALPVAAYAIDIAADGTGWVRLARPATGVVVAYTAGSAAAWGEVPAPIAQGVAMLVAHLFDDRDGSAAPPAAVAALWRPWRRLHLLAERHDRRMGP